MIEAGSCSLIDYDWGGNGGGPGTGVPDPCGPGGCPPGGGGGGPGSGPVLDLKGDVPTQLEAPIESIPPDSDPVDPNQPYHPWDNEPVDWWNPSALDVDCLTLRRKRLRCRLNCDDQEAQDLANGVDSLEAGITKLWCYRRCDFWYSGWCAF